MILGVWWTLGIEQKCGGCPWCIGSQSSTMVGDHPLAYRTGGVLSQVVLIGHRAEWWQNRRMVFWHRGRLEEGWGWKEIMVGWVHVVGAYWGSLRLGKKSIYEREETRFYKAMRSGKEHKTIHENVRIGHVTGSSCVFLYDFGSYMIIQLAIIPCTSIVAIKCLRFSLSVF